MIEAWFVPALAAVVSWLACRRLVNAGGRLMDLPNHRSLHEVPVPRGGGIGIITGVLTALFLVPDIPVALQWLMVMAVAIGVFSLFDDLFHLSPMARFLVQGGAAALLLAQGLWPVQVPLPGLELTFPPALAVIFGWLLTVWMTNLYNFMDGMDGFAGGMTLIGFSALAVLGWNAGDPVYALICLTVAAAAGAFLWFNFPPARLFMGDVGSTAMGFLAAGLMLWADRRGLFPLWTGVLIFSPFVVDATVTLVRRVMRGERIWEAHRSHYYQRLVQMGWGHRKTVLWEYAVMLLSSASALGAMSLSSHGQWILLILWVVIYGIIAILIDHRDESTA